MMGVMEEAPKPRLADRQQLRLKPLDVDSLIGREHPARAIRRVPERIGLSRLYLPIKAVVGRAGSRRDRPKDSDRVLALRSLGMLRAFTRAKAQE